MLIILLNFPYKSTAAGYHCLYRMPSRICYSLCESCRGKFSDTERRKIMKTKKTFIALVLAMAMAVLAVTPSFAGVSSKRGSSLTFKVQTANNNSKTVIWVNNYTTGSLNVSLSGPGIFTQYKTIAKNSCTYFTVHGRRTTYTVRTSGSCFGSSYVQCVGSNNASVWSKY